MKPKLLVLSILIPGLLLGCAPSQKSNSASSNSLNTPELPSNGLVSKNQSSSSDENNPKELGDWRVTLLPKEKKNSFDFYQVDYKFNGDLAATNVKIKVGNGFITSKKINKGDGGIIGSTFPIGEQQIEISIAWTEQNQSFSQTLSFNTGNSQK